MGIEYACDILAWRGPVPRRARHQASPALQVAPKNRLLEGFMSRQPTPDGTIRLARCIISVGNPRLTPQIKLELSPVGVGGTRKKAVIMARGRPETSYRSSQRRQPPLTQLAAPLVALLLALLLLALPRGAHGARAAALQQGGGGAACYNPMGRGRYRIGDGLKAHASRSRPSDSWEVREGWMGCAVLTQKAGTVAAAVRPLAAVLMTAAVTRRRGVAHNPL